MPENTGLDPEMKLEVGRMLLEGVSDEGIKAVVDDWKRQMSINPYATYAAFVEYGLPPMDPNNVVEGSIVKEQEPSIANNWTSLVATDPVLSTWLAELGRQPDEISALDQQLLPISILHIPGFPDVQLTLHFTDGTVAKKQV